MKNLISVLAFTMLALGVSAQSLQRDNLVGLHLIEVKLKDGVTMDQFKSFFVDQVLPEYEKQWIGLKGHLVKSVRGEYANRFGIVWVFVNEPTRNYYFNDDGSMNQREKDSLKGVEKIENELKAKFGSYTVQYKDDWVVQ